MYDDGPVTANQLTEIRLRQVAGGSSFDRGEEYVAYVHGLRVSGESATGSIQAKRVYLVDLDWSGNRVQGRCTCPHHAKGNFCKHLVALGLAVLDDTGTRARPPEPARDAKPSALAAYVAALDAPELRTLIIQLAERHPEVDRLLQVRASARRTDSGTAARELTGLVQQALRTRGFVDYRRSFDVAGRAQELLDELQDHLDGGAPEAVRPALLKAVTRLRTITLHADDSSGSLGDACQRAADLYARACREGSPDPVKLARWLAKFRDDSPGWPETTLPDFVAAFDERGLATYRRAVDALDAKYQGEAYERFEVDRMLLELADHDGDVDRAIALLSHRSGHVDYPGIVDRLNAAGRSDEAFAWLERGVAAGWVSARMQSGQRSFWLSPEEVVQAYVARGRTEDALDVQRGQFARQPEVPRFRALMDLAERIGSPETERTRAFATLQELARQPFGSGAPRIRIALAEGDLEGAWAVAEEFGAGDAWRELAGALVADFPGRAAALYRPWVDDALKVADTSKYPDIAATLDLMRELCSRSGAGDDFAAYLEELRSRYERRPSLMAQLDRRGL
jgi:uncharacterized Zn finger protein